MVPRRDPSLEAMALGIRLDLPDGWQVLSAGGDRFAAEYVGAPAHRDFRSRLSVAEVPGEPGKSTGSDLLAQALDGFALVDEGEGVLAGVPAAWTVGRYLARGRHPVTLVRWEGDGLAVSATLRDDDYDLLIDDLTTAVAGLARPGRLADAGEP